METSIREIKVVGTKNEVISTLAENIQLLSSESIKRQGHFKVGVSGGSLISFLRDGLPKIQADFSKWTIFFCDERVVPESSPDSTFGQYKLHLIDSTKLFEENQFVRIKQGVSAEVAATDYIQKLEQFFPKEEGFPKFDLLLLGMGPDGHTCSLFPGHGLLKEDKVWVAPIDDSPKPPPSRITLTFPVLNTARCCIFAVSGKEKANMIKRILVNKEDLPATKVQPVAGKVLWIVDEEAGRSLKS